MFSKFLKLKTNVTHVLKKLPQITKIDTFNI